MRPLLHVATFVLLGAAAAAQESIFAPLDLPAPNRYRSASGAPGPDYWQQEADYAIRVSLDPARRLVHGREKVTYRNHSPDPLDYLWVHLEQNRLRPDSIGARIGGGRAVGGASEPSEGVHLLAVESGGKALEYHVYDTLMRIELPETLAPREGSFSFEVEWEFEVPRRVFRRYGARKVRDGTIWEIAQWFPAVAVYDDVHGWNTLPYLGNGEFYTNFGTFDVHITVPADHLVVATGVLKNPEQVFTAEQLRRWKRAHHSEETVAIRSADEVKDPGSRPSGKQRLTWHFHAEKVRTFAWASSEAFVLDAASVGDVLVQSAYPREDTKVWSKSTQMLRTAIAGYSERWFPYPYPVATNVDGAEGGMEYPMIIFCRARSERGLWGVTTHEIGHTWFPMVVNTDERRHAWMDEGFNTFINIYSTQDRTGRPSRRSPAGLSIASRTESWPPIDTPPDRLNGMQLGMLEYAKTAAGLWLLREHVLGPERFDHAFRTYIRRWAFKSPRPADFFRSMEDAAGMDLAWFWRGWFLESAALDQAVERVLPGRGKRPARVIFANRGRMVMPLSFVAKFADGKTERREVPVEIWYSGDRASVTLKTPGEVREVIVDPDRVYPDKDRKNNVWKAKE